MKQVYLIICLLVTSFVFAQESAKTSDIDGFKLYPNPATQGKVFIQTTAQAPKKIVIFDVLGTKVLQTTILGNQLNVSGLDKGIYILRVLEKDKVATRKLIIK